MQALGGRPGGSVAGVRRLLSDAQSDLSATDQLSRTDIQKRFLRAQASIDRAQELLLSLPPSSERSKALLDLWAFKLQQLYSGPSRVSDQDRTLEAIFRVAPNFVLDQNIYSPPQIEHFEFIRQRQKELATATLSLSGGSPDLTFFLNGYPVGPAPLVVRVAPGTYRVETSLSDHHGVPRLVTVSDASSSQVRFDDVERLVQLDFGACMMASDSVSARGSQPAQLGALLGARRVVTVRPTSTASGESILAVEAFDVASGRRTGGAAVRLSGGKLASSDLDGLSGLLVSGEGISSERPTLTRSSGLVSLPESRPPPPRWIRPAAYVAGGLALGLGGFATYKGISAKNSHDKAYALLLPDKTIPDALLPQYNKYLSDGDADKKACYISAGVAVLFAGAAGVLGYLSREPGPPAIHF
jgi:hypothetical protein